MPEFNFDHIFTGTLEEQRQKTAHFLHGLKHMRETQQRIYAEATVFGYDSVGSLNSISKFERAYKAFAADPRSHELSRLCVEADKARGADDLRKQLDQFVKDLFA